MYDIPKLEDIASQVRRDIIRQVHAVSSGHPGGSLGCTDFLVALYFAIMDHNPEFKMEGRDEDVFFLSNGHISPLWYSVLARSGYFNLKELATFRNIDSRLQGHPATHEGLPGIRVASGSLGQGLSVGIGLALSKKLNGDEKCVFVLMGDGELQEGQVWEAAMFAAHHKVNNVIAAVDWNGQQIDGPTSKVMKVAPLREKWLSFGWRVLEMDGNNMKEVVDTLAGIKNEYNELQQPTVILMKTAMGRGVDYMEGTHKWHGKAPNDELTEKALGQLTETLGDY